MNQKFRLLFVGLLSLNISLLACSKPKTPTSASSHPPATQPASAPSAPAAAASTASKGPIKRGAAFTVDTETPLETVLANSSQFEGKIVKVRGKVARCCTKKGCWMELTADGVDQGVRVRFKDYAFFVPLDSAGSSALVEGQLNTRKLEDSMAEHLEGEGAKIFRNKAGEAIELALVATAVELTR